jgi:hypothetical protein
MSTRGEIEMQQDFTPPFCFRRNQSPMVVIPHTHIGVCFAADSFAARNNRHQFHLISANRLIFLKGAKGKFALAKRHVVCDFSLNKLRALKKIVLTAVNRKSTMCVCTYSHLLGQICIDNFWCNCISGVRNSEQYIQ